MWDVPKSHKDAQTSIPWCYPSPPLEAVTNFISNQWMYLWRTAVELDMVTRTWKTVPSGASYKQTLWSLDLACKWLHLAVCVHLYCLVTILLNVFAISSPLCAIGRVAIESKWLWGGSLRIDLYTGINSLVSIVSYKVDVNRRFISVPYSIIVMYIGVHSWTKLNSDYN